MSYLRMKSLLACILALGLSFYAWGSFAQNIVARSQLRRTVDPSPRVAFGTVLMKIDANGKETFQVNVKGVGQDNLGQFLFLEPSYTTNVAPALDLAPLNRINFKHGNWSRTLVGVGQAPADFLPFFDSLADVGGNEITVALPHIPDVTTIFTNINAGVTNISEGVTNVVGNTTNIINGIVEPNPGQVGEVLAVLWAPTYGLNAKPSTLSYHRRGTLAAVGDGSPNARGTVKIRFDGSTGRSVLDVRAVNLTRGQEYTIFVANTTNQDTTVMIPVDKMTQKNLGSTARFFRDTQFADPLPQIGDPQPQQARDVGDLSGHAIEIRDAFDFVHLAGVIP
jgi:hypothetical protein